MTNHSILKLAEIGLKSAIALVVLGEAVLIAIMIHSHFNPEPYSSFQVAVEHGSISVSFESDRQPAPSSYITYESSNDEAFYLSRLTAPSKLIVVLRMLISTVFTILILYYLLQFISSARRYDSFFEHNVGHFRKLGIVWIASAITSLVLPMIPVDLTMLFDDGKTVSKCFCGIDFLPIIACLGLSLLCFVASAVFQEGVNLREENKLTI